MNVSWDRKVKKFAYLPEYWLDLAQIWCRGYFRILNPKSTKKFYTTSFWRQNDVKVKYPYIACRKCIWRHYDVTFCSTFLKTSTFLLLIRDYQHTKFGLISVKESKVTEGGAESAPPPPVENVLNRPGEIGLNVVKLQYLTTNFFKNYKFSFEICFPRVNEKFSGLMVSSGGGMLTSEGDTCITPCISSKRISLTVGTRRFWFQKGTILGTNFL